MPQPYLVPVRPTCSLMTHSKGVSASAETSLTVPLILSFAICIPPKSGGAEHSGGATYCLRALDAEQCGGFAFAPARARALRRTQGARCFPHLPLQGGGRRAPGDAKLRRGGAGRGPLPALRLFAAFGRSN